MFLLGYIALHKKLLNGFYEFFSSTAIKAPPSIGALTPLLQDVGVSILN